MHDVIIYSDGARQKGRAVGSFLLALVFVALAGVAVYLIVTEGEWLLLLPIGVLALALVGVWIQFKPTIRTHDGPVLMAGSRGVGDMQLVVPWEQVRGISFDGTYLRAPRHSPVRGLSNAATQKLQAFDGQLRANIHYQTPGESSPSLHSIPLEAHVRPDSWPAMIQQVEAYARTRGVEVRSSIADGR